MNIDTQFPHTPVAAPVSRPVQANTEQESARPVDRPHRDEPSNNEARQDTGKSEATKETRNASTEARGVRPESELSAEDKRELDNLRERDREVRAHEAAHKAAAGNLARGGAQFETETGPDGRRYAVGGEVSIDTSKVPGDPEATIHKAETIRRAANAPAEPSSQDRAVATKASQIEAEARKELTEQRLEDEGDREHSTQSASTNARQPGFATNTTEPAPVGELLDIIV